MRKRRRNWSSRFRIRNSLTPFFSRISPMKNLRPRTFSLKAPRPASRPRKHNCEISPHRKAFLRLPTHPGRRTMKLVAHSANAQQVRWKALLYATGLGWLRLEGKPGALQEALQVLRDELQGQDGSLVALHRPSKMLAFDAWGTAGDALPLMKAV